MKMVMRVPFVFAKFLERTILTESGRLLFSLLNAFAAEGYRVVLFDNIPIDDLDTNGRISVSAIDNVHLGKSIPDRSEEGIYLFDKEDAACASKKWRKKVQVRFDIFAAHSFRRPLLMPYPMHPVHVLHHGAQLQATIEQLREGERAVRVFFSGDIKGYNKSRVSYPARKLPRAEVVATVLEKLDRDAALIDQEADFRQLFSGRYAGRCAVLDTSKLWVDDRQWLNSLAKVDFFLCPPGICMPMCHNAVEAMAVGAIPIISYPEWFNPGLSHLENCLVFGDKDDLEAQVRRALSMEKKEILAMRARVIDYYETHLKPSLFVDRVLSTPEERLAVLMVTEDYVTKNASRLNKRSIIIRGELPPDIPIWRRLLGLRAQGERGGAAGIAR